MKWTKEKIEFLSRNRFMNEVELAQKFGVSISALRRARYKFGIRKKDKRFHTHIASIMASKPETNHNSRILLKEYLMDTYGESYWDKPICEVMDDIMEGKIAGPMQLHSIYYRYRDES